ncbi:hypothetical protein V2J09_001309 [Rumex salicifolius]
MKNYSTFPSLFLQQHNSEFSQNQAPESSISLQMRRDMNDTGNQNSLQFRGSMYSSGLPYLTPSANMSSTIMSQCSSSNAEEKIHFVPPIQSNMSKKRPRDESHVAKRKVIQQPVNAQFLKAQPARRSQKLSDKITSLQKIVSPYGKTDTSSVLQEACMYIKIAHQEIRRLKISYFGARTLQPQLMDSTELRSKGLCLAPVSMASPLVIEDSCDVSTNNNTWGF